MGLFRSRMLREEATIRVGIENPAALLAEAYAAERWERGGVGLDRLYFKADARSGVVEIHESADLSGSWTLDVNFGADDSAANAMLLNYLHGNWSE